MPDASKSPAPPALDKIDSATSQIAADLETLADAAKASSALNVLPPANLEARVAAIEALLLRHNIR